MRRISIQLYSLRDIPDLDAQLRLVQAAGLSHVETTTANYVDLGLLRRLLDRYGLAATTGHFGIDRLREDFAGTVDLAAALGMETIHVWGLPTAQHWPNASGWNNAGKELGQIAVRLADHGLDFGYHNHDWELTRFAGGDCALDHLLDGAGEAPLRWQPDLAWLARGQANVETLLSRHAHRVTSAHIKDMRDLDPTAPEEGWASLGQGMLPWHRWLPALLAAGADPLVLEHDAPVDPERFLTESVAAINVLLGKAAP